jgi:hypothetical protein
MADFRKDNICAIARFAGLSSSEKFGEIFDERS